MNQLHLQARAHLLDVISDIVRVIGPGYVPGIKTLAHYLRTLRRAVSRFYNEQISDMEFIGTMIGAIEEQMRRAWNEGMRANDLDPVRDMRPEWEAKLEQIIQGEYNHVLSFAEAIQNAAKEGNPIAPLLARAELWANRYNDVVNIAVITTRPKDRFRWVLGATEVHCSTCLALNGIVATAQEWLESGWKPQSRELECGGWRCDCRFEYTEDKITPGGVPRL